MFKKIVLVVILIVGGVLLQDHESSASWVTTTVDYKGSVGKFTSIAIDTNNHVHISYLYGYPDYNLNYTTNTPGTWVLTTVDDTSNNDDSNVGMYTSIAIDLNNKLHISYQDNYPNWDLKYATDSGVIPGTGNCPGNANWNCSTIDSAGDVGYDTSIAIDSNNQVHISYYDKTN